MKIIVKKDSQEYGFIKMGHAFFKNDIAVYISGAVFLEDEVGLYSCPHHSELTVAQLDTLEYAYKSLRDFYASAYDEVFGAKYEKLSLPF